MIKSENAQLLIDRKPVGNDLTFTATDSKMEVQIEVTFNASELAGKELVTFEELYDVTNPDEPIKVKLSNKSRHFKKNMRILIQQ